MRFNEHWNLEGRHAFLSPSNPHWIRYDADKLIKVYRNMQAKQRGTELHAFAADAIRLGRKLSNGRDALNRHVNDAIGFGLQPEKILYYSDHCFGTADAINFDDGVLRIHDFKSGEHPASFDQLKVYAALFCLEYGFDPTQINIVLRIYQNRLLQSNEAYEEVPEADQILYLMDHIVGCEALLSEEDSLER